MGGTWIAAMGWFASLVTETGIDSSGLRRWTWLYVGGGGKKTCIVTAYQLCNPWKRTMGETVWDQQVCYFESCGKVSILWLGFRPISSTPLVSGRRQGTRSCCLVTSTRLLLRKICTYPPRQRIQNARTVLADKWHQTSKYTYSRSGLNQCHLHHLRSNQHSGHIIA